MTLLEPRPMLTTVDVAPRILLVVEGENDSLIVQGVLRAAGLPVGRFEIVAARGVEAAAHLARLLAQAKAGLVLLLAGSEERSLMDAELHLRTRVGCSDVKVLAAVPSVAAWLFADVGAASAHARSDEARVALRRAPLPEEIPDPHGLATRVFGRRHSFDWLARIDVGEATARSPSLRRFLEEAAALTGVGVPEIAAGAGRHVTRDVLANLLAEVPGEDVVWRDTSGGEHMANELRAAIEAGTPFGRAYASDILRVSRDLLRRTARRPAAR